MKGRFVCGRCEGLVLAEVLSVALAPQVNVGAREDQILHARYVAVHIRRVRDVLRNVGCRIRTDTAAALGAEGAGETVEAAGRREALRGEILRDQSYVGELAGEMNLDLMLRRCLRREAVVAVLKIENTLARFRERRAPSSLY